MYSCFCTSYPYYYIHFLFVYSGNVGDNWSVVGSDGEYTVDACFASGWYDKLHDMISAFMKKTNLSMLETDGPFAKVDNSPLLPSQAKLAIQELAILWTVTTEDVVAQLRRNMALLLNSGIT